MASVIPHAGWLKRTQGTVKSKDGKEIEVYELVVDDKDGALLSAWAKHFREHYCLDEKLDRLRHGTSKSRAEYLRDLVFPDATEDFGPATRSGDFAEILVADLVESKLGYWVPRVRYADKMVRNESPKGTDVVGFKIANSATLSPSSTDALITFESKAQMSGAHPKARLEDAAKDSAKDQWRIAEALNAIKRRLLDQSRESDANAVERFQDPISSPYLQVTGAAAVFCTSVFNAKKIAETDCSKQKGVANLVLVVVHSKALMKLVHKLYERSANEA